MQNMLVSLILGMIDRNEEKCHRCSWNNGNGKIKSMMEVGGWGTDTIVEDSELGLRLFEAGYIAHYK